MDGLLRAIYISIYGEGDDKDQASATPGSASPQPPTPTPSPPRQHYPSLRGKDNRTHSASFFLFSPPDLSSRGKLSDSLRDTKAPNNGQHFPLVPHTAEGTRTRGAGEVTCRGSEAAENTAGTAPDRAPGPGPARPGPRAAPAGDVTAGTQQRTRPRPARRSLASRLPRGPSRRPGGDKAASPVRGSGKGEVRAAGQRRSGRGAPGGRAGSGGPGPALGERSAAAAPRPSSPLPPGPAPPSRPVRPPLPAPSPT